jgi:FkbM family methyltransferase
MRSKVKKYLQTTLSQVGVHQRLKASCIYDFYWKMADRRVIEARYRQVEFYRTVLQGFRRQDLIFDVGANCGQKTDVFLRLGARVVAVDPDDENQSILREKFLAYRFSPKPVVVIGKALSDRDTIQTMWIDGPGSAINTLSEKWVDALRGGPRRTHSDLDSQEFARQKKVETTTLDQLMVAHGTPFYVKIDVEGYERTVLRGLQRPVPYLSFEVNLPEFRSEGLECVELLRRLAPGGKFNYAVDCGEVLAADRWLDAPTLSRVLEKCTASSVEVYWRNSCIVER